MIVLHIKRRILLLLSNRHEASRHNRGRNLSVMRLVFLAFIKVALSSALPVYAESGSSTCIRAFSQIAPNRSQIIFPSGAISPNEYISPSAEIRKFRQFLGTIKDQFGQNLKTHLLHVGKTRHSLLPEELKSKLTPEEVLVLMMYTEGKLNYRWVKALREDDQKQLALHEVPIKMLISALNKLPHFSGVSYRRSGAEARQAFKNYRPGAEVIDRGFMSSSDLLKMNLVRDATKSPEDLIGPLTKFFFFLRSAQPMAGMKLVFFPSLPPVNKKYCFRQARDSESFQGSPVRLS